MKGSILIKMIGGFACALFFQGGLWVSLTSGEPSFPWELRGTAVYDGHALAILSHSVAGDIRWVGVGEALDQTTVVRIERDRVVLLDEGGFPIELSDYSVTEPVARRKGLDGFLGEEFRLLSKIPFLLTSERRNVILGEIESAYEKGELVRDAASIHVTHLVPGEEWVVGSRTATDIPSLGLLHRDMIIQINGISPDVPEGLHKEVWKTILDVIGRAKFITVSFIRGEEIHSQFFEVVK